MINSKFLLLIMLSAILIIPCSAQKWTYNSNSNVFDGKYKSASVMGTGGEFPYNSPSFVVNYFYDKQILNAYITKGGYSGCDDKAIIVKFEGEDIKYVFSASSNSENDTWFFEENTYRKDNSDLSILDLLEKLKKYSIIHIRLMSDCGQTDYKFSLSGSTTAINYVADEYIKLEQKKEAARQLLADKKDRIEQLYKSGVPVRARAQIVGAVYKEPNFNSDIVGRLKEDENLVISFYPENESFAILIKAETIELQDTIVYYISEKTGFKIYSISPLE